MPLNTLGHFGDDLPSHSLDSCKNGLPNQSLGTCDNTKKPKQQLIKTANISNKQLSCCRETERRFFSLNILLSHSRSLKVIRNDNVELGMCMSLLVFHWNYVCISYCFWDIQRQIWRDLETTGKDLQGHWKWHCSI